MRPAPRPEAVTKPEELRLAAPESHRPLKNLVRGKRSLPSILLGYVNPPRWRRPVRTPVHTGVQQFHTLRVRLPHNAPPPRPSSRSGTHRAEHRPSRGGVKTLFRVPLRYLRSAACDPRFCARRGPTALPLAFPPTAPQAPKNPCSPPSAVLWPNLTSRSSSVYGLVPFLCGPSTTEGQDLPGPCFGACHGSRTPRSPPHQRGSLPSATTSALRFQSISWLNSLACRSPTLRLTTHGSRRKWWLASLGTCTRPHSTSLPGAHRGREPGYPGPPRTEPDVRCSLLP